MSKTTSDDPLIQWLLASDPSIKWQVLRDLLAAPEHEWSAERRLIETSGWGAELISHQDDDGQWAGGAFFPSGFSEKLFKEEGQPWTATCWALTQLCEFGWDPTSPQARRTVELVGKNSKWDEGGQPFWEGETEECINGRTIAIGSYLGANVEPIVKHLLTERQEDGGWNCERCNGSVRSSFATTINVLSGLLEYERATGGTPESIAARKAGEEYLLKRVLLRRLSNGEPADDKFLQLVYPTRWHYNVLRALDYFRATGQLTGQQPDARLKEAVEHVRSKQREDGRWAQDRDIKGRTWLTMDAGLGKPSPWITLHALRVLKWWDAKHV